MILRLIYYISMSAIMALPAALLLLDLLYAAGIIESPDPGLVKRMRPF